MSAARSAVSPRRGARRHRRASRADVHDQDGHRGARQLQLAQGPARNGQRLVQSHRRSRGAAGVRRRNAGRRAHRDQDAASRRGPDAGQPAHRAPGSRRSTKRSTCSACRSSSRPTKRPCTCARKLTPLFEKRLEAKGFKLLAWGSGGWVQLFSKMPIKTLDEVKKAKIYTSEGDDKMVNWYKNNGFNPVAISLSRHPGRAEDRHDQRHADAALPGARCCRSSRTRSTCSTCGWRRSSAES